LADKKKSKEIIKSKPIVKPVAAKEHSNALLTWVCVAAIAVVTYFVLSPCLDDGFTNWDDNTYVTENPVVMSNTVQWVKILETPVSANYHPLTILSLALNYQSGKLDPFGYHLENLIFHLLNTILVFFFIFLLMRRNLLMAAIAALLFGIHPMHVESVTWISERKDVLYLFFLLAGLITYLRYIGTKKTGWYIFTLLLFILSCLSKGMAVIFPVILLLIDYLRGVKRERRLLLEKIPFFLLSVTFGIIAIKTQANDAIAGINTFTFFQRIMFASYDAMMYMVRFIVPFKLSVYYPYPSVVDSNGIPLIFYLSPFILLGIIAALIYFYLKKEKEIVFGLLFYFVSVALVLQLISVGSAIMADRYTYLSYIGLCFIAAYLINKAWQSKRGVWASVKYPFMIIAITGAVTFSYMSYSRAQVWKNSETLWTNVIENYPDVSIAYIARGKYYHVNHAEEKAMADYNTAIQLPPSDITSLKSAYYNRGMIYSDSYNKNDLAIADYTKAIELDSTYAEPYNNRGLIYLRYGKNDLALPDLNKAIALNPALIQAYYNRGLIYSIEGKNDLAITDFTNVIKLDSTFADTYIRLGLVYSKTGNNNMAIAAFNKAVELDTPAADAYAARGAFYWNTGKGDLALADYNKAIALNPSSAIYYYNRGLYYKAVNENERAVDDFTKAIDLDPSVAVFWYNRSVAENKMGQNDIAKADALKAQQLQVPHP
jgi:protein O-mannosyl-transferase